jgi:hypothetical protein
MNDDPQTTETARALLYRHGLPEDIIDGALCLHAQEMAAAQRREADDLHQTEPGVVKGLRIGADLIDPTVPDDTDLSEADVDRMMAAGTPVQIVTAPPSTYGATQPPVDRAALRDRIAEVLTPFFANFSDEDTARVNAGEAAAALAAVLPAGRVLHGTADTRAATLRDAEARLRARAAELVAAADADPLADMKRATDARRHSAECWNAAADELRRLAGETPADTKADDEALRAKVDDATATLRRVRSKLETLKDQGATGQTYYQTITDALAGPRPDAAPETPTPEQVAREHVTSLHLIGEQLATIEFWFWEHLADVRAAGAGQNGAQP